MTKISLVETHSSQESLKRFRFVEVCDAGRKQRLQIISELLPAKYVLCPTSGPEFLSQSQHCFDALFVSVDDFDRLRYVFPPPGNQLIRNKLSLVFTSKADPKQRAKLLRMGFDDVFQSSMAPGEVHARLESLFQRSEVYNLRRNELESEDWRVFKRLFLAQDIKGHQDEVLRKLFFANNEVVKYENLATYDFVTQSYRKDSLKATVCRIRRILKGCEIVSHMGQGYSLRILDGHVRANAAAEGMRPVV